MKEKQKNKRYMRKKRFYTTVALIVVIGMVLSATVVFVDFLSPMGGSASYSLPEVVAAVNEEEIKKEEFNFHMGQVKAFYEMQGVNLESRENENMLRQVQWDVLQELIGEVLLVQQAEKEGLTVGEDMVQAEYKQILDQFEGDEEALEDQLALMDFNPEDLRKVIYQQLTAQQYIEHYKEENIEEEDLEVTEEEIKRLYEQYSTQWEDMSEGMPEEEMLEEELLEEDEEDMVVEDVFEEDMPEEVPQQEMPDYEKIKFQLEEELRQQKIDQIINMLTRELKEESDIEIYI